MSLMDEFDMYYNQIDILGTREARPRQYREDCEGDKLLLVSADDDNTTKPDDEPLNNHICSVCNVEYIIDDSNYVCPSCGVCHPITYEDASNDSRSLTSNKSHYKHMNHLSEILNQLQGKQIFLQKDAIVADVKRVLGEKEIDYFNVRQAMKKLKYSTYYGQIYLILYELDNNQHPPTISRYREEKIKNIFHHVLREYQKIKKSFNRHSFLNYYFVLRQICIRFGYNDLVKYFPEMKTINKLNEQLAIWNQIMNN